MNNVLLPLLLLLTATSLFFINVAAKNPTFSSPFVRLSQQNFAARQNENSASCIASSGSDVHVVWYYTFSNTDAAVYYIRSTDGGSTWGNEVRISPKGTVIDGDPYIAVCGSYVHVVYWRNPYNTQDGIYNPPTQSYYRRSINNGDTWEKEVLLANNYTFWPGLACDGDWVYVNLNTAVSPTNTEVFFVSSSDNGANFGDIQRVTHANGRSEDPAISAYRNKVYMAWNDNRGDLVNLETYYTYSKDNGQNWEPQVALSALPTLGYSPAIDVQGDTVVVMMANKTQYLLGCVSTDGGSQFGNLQTIENTLLSAGYPIVLIDPSNTNTVYVTFGLVADTLHNYFLQSTNAGRTWSHPSAIATWPSEEGFPPPTFMAYGKGSVLHVSFQMATAPNAYDAIWYSSAKVGAKKGRRGNRR